MTRSNRIVLYLCIILIAAAALVVAVGTVAAFLPRLGIPIYAANCQAWSYAPETLPIDGGTP